MKHSPDMPTFDALQAVLSANRTGSFSSAADELDITHGAISRRVAAVEAWAGTALFERHGRGVRLTIEGQRLVRLFEEALELIDSGAAEWRENRQPETVRISVLPSFARFWILPNLAILEGSPPDLRIELELDRRYAQLNEVDVAIRYGRGDWSDGVAMPLFDEVLTPAASPDLARRLGEKPSVSDIIKHPLIHDAYPDAWRIWLGEQGHRYKPRPQDRRYPDYDLGLHAAAAGCGVVLLRMPYGQVFVRNGSLIPVGTDPVASQLKFYAITERGPKRRAIRTLLERIALLSSNEVHILKQDP
ncbi:LysR substrate-binding domain-containing protein [Phyllobacterium myrsinacearum]|uniref:DNA-binding transcriptional LysR family regulator n=1 Tax=Phyllobacterium myrsinacearum TaxID=28101 RepID=A0A839EHM9_9HYPH|nr:LysR substrate-binding domain-containing protein [Phyllobacterium myrsinacearum]MBA8879491.1 DNA-binding transcriptional LysR family regulator [Phyllobacterium myrsinacearum]